MIRNVMLAILATLLGHLVIFAGEAATWTVFPPPAGADFTDPEKARAIVAAMPLGAFAGIELGYVMGSLVAGGMIGRFAQGSPWRTAGVVGLFFTLANLANLASVPSPTGFAVLTTATFLPVTFVAAFLSRRPG